MVGCGVDPSAKSLIAEIVINIQIMNQRCDFFGAIIMTTDYVMRNRYGIIDEGLFIKLWNIRLVIKTSIEYRLTMII